MRAFTPLLLASALAFASVGAVLGHNPPGDPLPVNGEPNCFGARVGHSASQHGLTPKAKIDETLASLELFAGTPGFEPWEDYYAEHGVSVRTVQQWIRLQCSEDAPIPNP